MSEVKIPVPYLNVELIRSLESEILLYTGGGSGWMLSNRIESEARKVNSLLIFIEAEKVKYQYNCIIVRLEKIKNMLQDYVVGNFQPYIDEHIKYSDYDTPEWEPYEELEYLLSTNGIEDLPDNMNRFAELVGFLTTLGYRKKALKEGFRQFFSGVQFHYQQIDQEGNTVFVPESEMPLEVLEEMDRKKEIKDGFESIEYEYCFDNYDEWLACIKSKVAERRPFSEMIELIR